MPSKKQTTATKAPTKTVVSKTKTVESAPAPETKKSTQLEKSLVRAIQKKNSNIGKAPKTLGSTRGAELKKIKALNKKKAGSKKKSERKPPAAGSLPFLTYKHAVDTALFFCPGKYLDKKEVCEFINKTFRNTGHDDGEASQKKLLKQVDKVLKRGAETDQDAPVRYNAIVAAGEGSVLNLIYKYKLDPKLRAKKTAEFNFQPVFPEGFQNSVVKDIQNKKAFVVPAYQKRSSSKKSAPKTEETKMDVAA